LVVNNFYKTQESVLSVNTVFRKFTKWITYRHWRKGM